ncbi:MAG: type VI secretion system tip protein VgrG [Nitrospina sp.]|nr:type VI secretion system tip protein VgrG [Nitrospina sp.]
MATYDDENLSLKLTTPLGPDKLLLKTFHGEEKLSEPYFYYLDMVSQEYELDFDQIVGEGVTITMDLSSGEQKYFHGIVTRFIQGAFDGTECKYFAEVRPWMWQLYLTQDSRIFQEMKIPDIITKVFDDLGFSDYKDDLTKTYEEVDYCVQYQETAYNFVQRLMEDNGICYYFEHEEGKHTLVLSDDSTQHPECPGVPTVTMSPPDSTMIEEDTISQISLEKSVGTGKYAMDDFDFETPSTDLLVTDVEALEAHKTTDLRVYEYPGGFKKSNVGDDRTKLRIESLEYPVRLVNGQGNCRDFRFGYKFTLEEHEREDINDTYLIYSLQFTATQDSYHNAFTAFPADTPFRPEVKTRRPRIVGSQTAIVVGKDNEEIYTDKYGRIKVQFHWDQEGENNENSSCWVRVTQGWAGKGWGMIFIPRIGMEVVVSFLEGDPDKPLVTGCVYNAEQTVPYDLPDDQTRSTIKTDSSKDAEGFNEIRFEDKADEEEIYVHAQKDMNIEVLNDETRTITKNRTTTIEEENDTLTVSKGDRTFEVTEGNETTTIGGDREITVSGDETRTNEGDYTVKVEGDYKITVEGDLTIEVTGKISISTDDNYELTVGGDYTNDVDGDTSTTVGGDYSVESDGDISQTASGDFKNETDGDMTNSASGDLTNEADGDLTNSAGGDLTDEADGDVSISATNEATVSGMNVTAEADIEAAVSGSTVSLG